MFRTFLRLGAPLAWALHFLVLYGAEFLVCSRWGSQAYAAVVAGATLAALAVLVFVVRSTAAGTGFVDRVAFALGLMGLGGVLATTMPAFMIPMCVGTA
ncbi:MAG: hypothetical protein FJX54_01220 [Alphaproteobacteria bacterium]|nr:hypothetical protein [Alphaproteobacteria bacterium]